MNLYRGWWINVRRRLPAAAVCVAVGILLAEGTALGQRTRSRTIPACTSPEFAPRIMPRQVRVPVGGKRTVTTAIPCDVESLLLSRPRLRVVLTDGDDLSTRSFFGADHIGTLISSRTEPTPVPADQLDPFFNAIKQVLVCRQSTHFISGLGVNTLDTREGLPPSCVEPIDPTKADDLDQADLMVQVQGDSSRDTLDFFPGNISGNPEAELTVPACCFLPGALDPAIKATNLAFKDLGRLLRVLGNSTPPTPHQGSSGCDSCASKEDLNAQTELTEDEDKANQKVNQKDDIVKMPGKLTLKVTTVFFTNEQAMVVGGFTVEGPFPWVPVSGSLLDNDGTFVARGKGTVAGFPSIAVTLEGRLTPGGIVGDYTMGADGGLPQGEPIIYSVEGRLEEWDTFFDELSGVFLEAAEAAAGLNFEAPIGGVDWGAAMQSITGELLRTEAGLLYLDAEGAETMPGDGLRGVETALTGLAGAVAGSTLISRGQTEANLQQAAAQFGEAAALMDKVSVLARVTPTGTAGADIQQLLDSLQATAPLLEAVPVSALGNAFTTVSAADFTGPVAPGSIVSGFGETGAAVEIALVLPLPTTLGGVSIRVTDSEGADHAASFFFSSSGQLNFLIPEPAAVGDAVITVFAGNQVLATGSVRIEPVAPTLFSANATGEGVAAARFLLVANDGSRVEEFIFDSSQTPRTAIPIDLSGQGDQVFLLLFGTGIRGFSDEVTATVNGIGVRVLGAAAHSMFEGLDQVNIGPMPVELIGAGEVDIVLGVESMSRIPLKRAALQNL